MLECVVNVSEGRDQDVIAALAASARASLIDLHSDAAHHRSVFTLAGVNVLSDAIALATTAITHVDLSRHSGAHPRLGAVDVVPFVPLGSDGLVRPFVLEEAIAARTQFAETISARHGIPCFCYGPERTLPSIRANAFRSLPPDYGPMIPHPTAGAICVGARGVLVAYNVNVEGIDADAAQDIARSLRGPSLRSLAFELRGGLQISCNLIDPLTTGLVDVYDRIATLVHQRGGSVANGELVGLLPKALLERVPQQRWGELGLSERATIESCLVRATGPICPTAR